MKKTKILLTLFATLFFISCAPKDKPVPIELWYGATFGEAGEPPANWEVYGILKRKLNIDLSISALPGTFEEADKKIMAAVRK